MKCIIGVLFFLLVAHTGISRSEEITPSNAKGKIVITDEDIKGMIYGPYGAENDFKNAAAVVDRNHPVRVYLAIAELAGIRTLQVAIERKIGDSGKRKTARQDLRETYTKPRFEAFKSLLSSQRLDKEGQWASALIYWETLLGL